MAADSTAYDAVLKEVWTGDALEEQLYQANPLLENIERINPSYSVGDKAIVPVHTGRAGGYSAVPRTGTNNLNAADAQEVNQATYNYTHHWFQVEIDTAIVDESSSKSLAVASVVDVEVMGALNDLRKQLTRQAFGNGDAIIAKCGTTTASTEVELDTSDYGYDAIVRGWLYPGLAVDIGTAADEDNDVAGSVITAVEENSASPSITIGSAITTNTSDFVSVADARSGTTSYEMNGLRNLIAASGSVGGINPSSVPSWAAQVDSTSQALSLNAIYQRQQAVFQKTGQDPDWALTSPKQYTNLFKLLQSQVRYDSPNNLEAGIKGDALKVQGTSVQRQPDVPDRAFYFLTKKDLFTVRTKKPVWAPQEYGKQNILEWKQGSTRLVSGLVYRLQLGLRRRNSHSALTNLT